MRKRVQIVRMQYTRDGYELTVIRGINTCDVTIHTQITRMSLQRLYAWLALQCGTIIQCETGWSFYTNA